MNARRAERTARELWRTRSVSLVVVAHPDDAEILFGATMLRLTDEGGTVYVAVATNGEKGCVHENVASSRVARLRRKEQLHAAEAAGVKRVFFLDLPDGELEDHKPVLRERIAYYLRRVKPEFLYTFDSQTYFFSRRESILWRSPLNHPDHRAVGDAALAAACYSGPSRRFYPNHIRAGNGPWLVREIFLGATHHPNFKVDSRPYRARKMALIDSYASQRVEWLKELGAALETSFRRLKLRRACPSGGISLRAAWPALPSERAGNKVYGTHAI